MTIEAAQEHDRLIASAFHRIVGSEAGSPAQCERALRQARLPVKLGGLGLTSMAAIRRAAWVGTWALVWTPLRQLHAPFRAVDITAESAADFQQLSIFTELQDAHSTLLDDYDHVARTYEQYDRQVSSTTARRASHITSDFTPTASPTATPTSKEGLL